MASRSSSHDLNNTAKPLPIIPRRSSALSNIPSGAPELMGNSSVTVTIERPTPPHSNRRTPPASAVGSDSSSDSENRRLPHPRKGGDSRALSSRAEEKTGVSYAVGRKQQRGDARRRRPVVALFDACGSSSEEEALPTRSSRRASRAKVLSTPSSSPSLPSTPIPEKVLKPKNSIIFPGVAGMTASRSASFSTPSPYDGSSMIRKKSGEPVRSSLKGSRPKLRADLSIVTTGLDIQTSKSEPTTPNKSVHFDSKLEHVRLFIAAQKPLAVSVDGSPTEDTSGTESDFPSFIFGDSVRPVPVVMQLSNMPPIINVHSDVALEELKMSPSSLDIVGSARVRNLAFEKRVAVRFTFDAWQTTSEVTAKFISSIGNSFDRFGFTIRLSDIMSRVEGKTLVLALRYSVDGRDIWDNNGGGNYVATFKKAPLAARVKTKIEELSSESDVAVLQEKLETVVRKRDRATTAGATSMSKQTSEPTTLRQLPLSLSARYDFSNSWRNSWSGASSSQTEAYGRRHSPTNVSSIPWPAKQGEKKASALSGKPLLGSPREPDWMGSTVSSNALTNPELRDPDAMNTPGGTPRRHQRGYFDYVSPLDNTTLRRTPPGTPKLWSLDDLTPVSSPKLAFGGIQRADEAGTDMFSPPPLLTVSSSDVALGTAFFPALQRMGSTESDASTSSILSGDESTPSIVSPSSGSSRSSSPCPSDTSLTSPHEDYSQFLNRFCFFTGDSSSSPLRPPMLARSSSSSSVSSSGSSQSVAISASSSTTTITPTPSTACLGSADDVHNLSTPRIAFTPPPAPASIST